MKGLSQGPPPETFVYERSSGGTTITGLSDVHAVEATLDFSASAKRRFGEASYEVQTVNVMRCGYSGLMLPILEDPVLAERVSEGGIELSARLFTVPGKKAGDPVEFTDPLLCPSKGMSLSS